MIDKKSLKLAKVYLEPNFTEEIDALRLLCFPPSIPVVSSRDEFDSRSLHMVIRIENEIAAYLRLTPGPQSVFETWTQGKAQIPTGKDVIDIGRFLINPKYRGNNLFEPLVIAAFMYADLAGFKYAVGSFKVGRKLIAGGYRIGFVKSGMPADAIEPNGNRVTIQPVACELSKNRSLSKEIIAQNTKSLEEKGYYLDYSIIDKMRSEKSKELQDKPDIYQDVGATAFYVIYYKNDGKKIDDWRDRSLIKGTSTTAKAALFKDSYIEKLAKSIPGEYIDIAKSRVAVNPLFGPAHAVRQRYFNRSLSEAVKNRINNASQVILLGAGLDTRSVRKKKYNVQFFEIDLPHVIEAKRRLFADLQIDQNSTYIALDYTKDNLIKELDRHGVKATEPTHIIWEGNIVYLTMDQVQATIAAIKNYFISTLTMSFDYHSDKVVQNNTGDKNLTNYTEVIAKTGSRFVTGINNIYHFAREFDIDVIEDFTANELINLFGFDNQPDSILGFYHCCTIKFKKENHNTPLQAMFHQHEQYKININVKKEDLNEFYDLRKTISYPYNTLESMNGYNANDAVLLAKHDNKVIGGLTLTISHPDKRNDLSMERYGLNLKQQFPFLASSSYFELSSLVVLPEYKKHCIEHKLLMLALKTARERGCQYMLTCIPPSMDNHYSKLFADIGFNLNLAQAENRIHINNKELTFTIGWLDVKCKLINEFDNSCKASVKKDERQTNIRSRL